MASLMGFAIFAGLLAFHALFFVAPPTEPSSFPPSDAQLQYRNALRSLGLLSALLLDLAAGAGVAFAWLTATAKSSVPEGSRRGLLVFAAVFVGVWIVISSFIYSSLRFSFL